MRRLVVVLAVAGVLAIGAASLARAAEPFAHTGRVLISNQGDVAILPGEHADGIVVINGNADVRGEEQLAQQREDLPKHRRDPEPQ